MSTEKVHFELHEKNFILRGIQFLVWYTMDVITRRKKFIPCLQYMQIRGQIRILIMTLILILSEQLQIQLQIHHSFSLTQYLMIL